jgi:uncharacterized protein YjeT (DUF2065 family)
MHDFLTAVAMALVLEGLAYAAFPEGMQRMMRYALASPPGMLRWSGLVLAVLGVALVAILRFAHFAG